MDTSLLMFRCPDGNAMKSNLQDANPPDPPLKKGKTKELCQTLLILGDNHRKWYFNSLPNKFTLKWRR